MLKLLYIFGHVFTVNSRYYGRCYVKRLIPLSTFLKFHTHLEENSVRSFLNVLDKSSRFLILAFPRNGLFHEHRHILGYHPLLTKKKGWSKRNRTSNRYHIRALCPFLFFFFFLQDFLRLKRDSRLDARVRRSAK